MKTITSFLLKFCLAATLLTVVFRYCLSYGIENNSTMIMALSAAFYALTMFISGWYFGKKDGEYLPVFDIGFRFHLSTYLIHNIISGLWFAFRLNSRYEGIGTVRSTAIIWGIVLIIHSIFFLWARRNSINSLNKEDLFD